MPMKMKTKTSTICVMIVASVVKELEAGQQQVEEQVAWVVEVRRKTSLNIRLPSEVGRICTYRVRTVSPTLQQ